VDVEENEFAQQERMMRFLGIGAAEFLDARSAAGIPGRFVAVTDGVNKPVCVRGQGVAIAW
jgi:hypothetical protein